MLRSAALNIYHTTKVFIMIRTNGGLYFSKMYNTHYSLFAISRGRILSLVHHEGEATHVRKRRFQNGVLVSQGELERVRACYMCLVLEELVAFKVGSSSRSNFCLFLILIGKIGFNTCESLSWIGIENGLDKWRTNMEAKLLDRGQNPSTLAYQTSI